MTIQGQSQNACYWAAMHPVNKVNTDTREGFNSFTTYDGAINFLYTIGERELAKQLHNQVKGSE